MADGDPLVAPVFGDHLSGVIHGGSDGASMDATVEAAKVLGHRFARPDLLREALTHRSAVGGGARAGARGGRAKPQGAPPVASNERLEFVGDRVLGLLIAEWLAERFPREQEGDLGRRLARLVSQPILAVIAEEAGLPGLLAVAPGESRAGVRTRATVLADAMEAVIGALYADGGLEAARRFVRRAWETAMAGQIAPPKDAKTALQEWAQQRGLDLPAYALAGRDGPPHAPRFTMRVLVDGRSGEGVAGTKQAAEQAAALDLLGRLAPALVPPHLSSASGATPAFDVPRPPDAAAGPAFARTLEDGT